LIVMAKNEQLVSQLLATRGNGERKLLIRARSIVRWNFWLPQHVHILERTCKRGLQFQFATNVLNARGLFQGLNRGRVNTLNGNHRQTHVLLNRCGKNFRL